MDNTLLKNFLDYYDVSLANWFEYNNFKMLSSVSRKDLIRNGILTYAKIDGYYLSLLTNEQLNYLVEILRLISTNDKTFVENAKVAPFHYTLNYIRRVLNNIGNDDKLGKFINVRRQAILKHIAQLEETIAFLKTQL